MSRSVEITIIHRESGAVLTQEPRGWSITPSEGNYYVKEKYLARQYFSNSAIPGLCIHKGIYHRVTLNPPNIKPEGLATWRYVMPNPLFPFIAFSMGISGHPPALDYRQEPTRREQSA